MSAVRSIARAWRRSAPQRTLLACSGGADSCALVLALAAAAPAKERAARLVVAHILHDLRPLEQARADADLARQLAEFAGVAFVSAEVHPAKLAAKLAAEMAAQVAPSEPRRNLEALARRERYAALVDLARAHSCDAIATAHHAGDQAETVLMRLLRGTGIDGLRAIHPQRALEATPIDPDTTPSRLRLIRPMLGVLRADAEAICNAAAWQWGTDHTNMDTSRTRAWIRHEVVPMLEARAPGASRRLASMAAHAQSAHEALRHQARDLWRAARVSGKNSEEDAAAITFDRDVLRAAPAHITSMVLRRAVRRAAVGQRMDKVSAHTLADAVAIVHDRVGGERQIRLAGASMCVTRDHVRVAAAC